MKVCELIERLRQFDQNTEVCCIDDEFTRFVLIGDIEDIDGELADEGEDSPDTIYLCLDIDA
jgi:benzoyl-CoA reductase/2-hydroxyglutaryl-CoA dehydratase subunit BcrC/BadD/HgdB